MSPPLVLLAHAPSAEEHAAEIAVQLAALGYAVDALPDAPRARNARLNAAHRLIILWSRDAATAPGLRAVARMARAANKLACVRLDGARPPPGVCSKISIRLPRGRTQNRAWQRLLSDRTGGRKQTTSTIATRTTTSAIPGTRLAGIGAALVMSFVIAASLYVVDSGFAQRVNTWAEHAQLRAGQFMDSLKTQERDG
jgi:hypothetical protein